MQPPASILVVDNDRCCVVGAWAKLREQNEIGMPPEQESLPSSTAPASAPHTLPGSGSTSEDGDLQVVAMQKQA